MDRQNVPLIPCGFLLECFEEPIMDVRQGFDWSGRVLLTRLDAGVPPYILNFLVGHKVRPVQTNKCIAIIRPDSRREFGNRGKKRRYCIHYAVNVEVDVVGANIVRQILGALSGVREPGLLHSPER